MLKDVVSIGIDPGKDGAIAVLTESTHENRHRVNVEYLPRLGRWTPRQIRSWLFCLTGGEKAYCVMEFVRSSPQMGVVSAFTFGRGFGQLEGVLAGLDIDCVVTSPMKWQKAMSCRTKGDKNVTKRAAQKLFPDIRCTHYNSDALLIAEYCRRFVDDLFE